MFKKLLEIFRPGKHIASNGAEVEFSDADVKAIAESYDPELHEAPIVIGHPKANAPAFGWVKSLVFDKVLKAVPSQLNPEFVEAVRQGAYKKISASFYSPDSPNNPAPGRYYLRHVGFLGAQPPAVKGLAAVEFAEDDITIDAEIDFSEIDLAWNDKAISRILRTLKNFFIDKYSQEDADRAIPEWDIEGVSSGSAAALADAAKPASSDFSEAEKNLRAELEAERKARQDAEKKAAVFELEKRQKANIDFVEAQIKAGRVLPAQKEKLVGLMNSLPDNVEFSEGCRLLESIKEYVASQPAAVNFEEIAPAENKEPEDEDPHKLAAKALEYQEKEAKAGRLVSISEAVRLVKG